MGDEVGFNFFKGVPRESAAVKDGGVFRLAEVKQVGWVKHAATVTKQLRRESVILSGISVNDPEVKFLPGGFRQEIINRLAAHFEDAP